MDCNLLGDHIRNPSLTMSRSKTLSIFGLSLLSTLMISCHSAEVMKDLVVGVKIYDHKGSMAELFEQWNDIGINAAFSSPDLLANTDYRRLAKEQNIVTFVIFPVFFNAEELAGDPDLYAITSEGNQAKDEWVEFVCPSRENYRDQMVEKAKEMIREYDPDGISIDFIRHFVYWEKVYPDREPGTLPLTCFDSTCLLNFQEQSGITIPGSQITTTDKASWILENHSERWTKWRSALITSMVREITNAAREIKPEILVNVHLVPWASEDYNGAINRVAGQDIKALSQIANFLSPMTYSHMLKREPEWIHSIVEELYLQSGSHILPSIQVSKAYLENELDPNEFEQCVREAIDPPSQGVVFWSWERLSEDPEKIELLKDILEMK